ncbi:hypothetical protein [Paraflavitalea sp. CAU 1676]|uniref:hypothetical protein n=1 Tax=Paraflavitalea sp. CAU 1676 TaxID=3032598 RepID=UPI0023DBD0EA|nr:hypothetical protein [Paraflavitalea sp. CAU 1676]MDF2188541.1 hypothetical protein [Paraflavitalea sp. CAU 1676]
MDSPFQGLSITEGNTRPHNAADAIQSFFSSFSFDEVHLHLSRLAACALTESQGFFEAQSERNSTLFFCEQAWYAFQGIYRLKDDLQQLHDGDATGIQAQSATRLDRQ